MGDQYSGEKGILSTSAESSAPDMQIPPGACLLEEPGDPCTIVILGASGDLARRKLVPALYNLFLQGGLPETFAIVGGARTEYSSDDFRGEMHEAISSGGGLDLSRWGEFARRLYYHHLDYDSLSSYQGMAEFLKKVDKDNNTQGNRIFYMALPMFMYESTSQMIGSAGLSREKEDGNGWARLVVEKPFGTDLKSARKLDATIHESFNEEQVYRIDHYLAKETVQNLLMFRFANSIFEPIWDRRYIDSVDIIAAEELGIEKRAGYYDQSGVLRDMFQNHMLQLVALTAIEPPSLFESNRVQDEKAKVFRSLRPFPVDSLSENIVFGQYGAGKISGRDVVAYRDEPNVDPHSITPTFAAMKVHIDNWRWHGVPFYLTSGKRLKHKLTQITIRFRKVPHLMFRNVLGEQISPNHLTLGIYPEEKIALRFQTKNPGALVCLRPVDMNFSYLQNYHGPVLDAYEKAIIDCMQGDHMLFLRQDSVELCWEFIDPVLEACEQCADPNAKLRIYESGSWGPEDALELKKSRSTNGQ